MNSPIFVPSCPTGMTPCTATSDQACPPDEYAMVPPLYDSTGARCYALPREKWKELSIRPTEKVSLAAMTRQTRHLLDIVGSMQTSMGCVSASSDQVCDLLVDTGGTPRCVWNDGKCWARPGAAAPATPPSHPQGGHGDGEGRPENDRLLGRQDPCARPRRGDNCHACRHGCHASFQGKKGRTRQHPSCRGSGECAGRHFHARNCGHGRGQDFTAGNRARPGCTSLLPPPCPPRTSSWRG